MAHAQRESYIYNLNEMKRLAKQSIDAGAVTKDYPLDLKQACKLLNEALATEIMCVLRYRHHQIIAAGIDYPQIAEEFREHAENEEQHMLKLAERIHQLGGNPDFNPSSLMQRTATEYGTATNLKDMIKEDLIAERIVIMIYHKMINWFGTDDPTTRRLLEDILKDEEDHANELASLLTSQ